MAALKLIDELISQQIKTSRDEGMIVAALKLIDELISQQIKTSRVEGMIVAAPKLIDELISQQIKTSRDQTYNKIDAKSLEQSVVAILPVTFFEGTDDVKSNHLITKHVLPWLQKLGDEPYIEVNGNYFAIEMTLPADQKALMTLSGRGGSSHFCEFFCLYCCQQNHRRSKSQVVICEPCGQVPRGQGAAETPCRHEEIVDSKTFEESLTAFPEWGTLHFELPPTNARVDEVRRFYERIGFTENLRKEAMWIAIHDWHRPIAQIRKCVGVSISSGFKYCSIVKKVRFSFESFGIPLWHRDRWTVDHALLWETGNIILFLEGSGGGKQAESMESLRNLEWNFDFYQVTVTTESL